MWGMRNAADDVCVGQVRMRGVMAADAKTYWFLVQ